MVDHGIPWSSDHHFHLGRTPNWSSVFVLMLSLNICEFCSNVHFILRLITINIRVHVTESQMSRVSRKPVSNIFENQTRIFAALPNRLISPYFFRYLHIYDTKSAVSFKLLSDLVGNPDDRYSRYAFMISLCYLFPSHS